jgi:GNAT superfamily N-acetyltransferase
LIGANLTDRAGGIKRLAAKPETMFLSTAARAPSLTGLGSNVIVAGEAARHQGGAPMPITIRPSRGEDAELLPSIERSAGEAFLAIPDLAWLSDHAVTSVEQHRDFIRARASWVADRTAEGPVGFVCVERCEGGVMHIHELAVRHDRQRRGAGRALMEAAIAQGRREGLSAVTLNTFRDVPWNAPFYAELGFGETSWDQLDARLRGLVRNEIARGLPGERRCVMRLGLS